MANGGTSLECEPAMHPYIKNSPFRGVSVGDVYMQVSIWSFYVFKEKVLWWKENMEVTAGVTLYGPHRCMP